MWCVPFHLGIHLEVSPKAPVCSKAKLEVIMFSAPNALAFTYTPQTPISNLQNDDADSPFHLAVNTVLTIVAGKVGALHKVRRQPYITETFD